MVKKSDKEMWFKAKCPTGQYFAYVNSKYSKYFKINTQQLETPWQSTVNQFTIASYGPGLINFEMKPKSPPQNLLEKMLIKKAQLDKSSMKYYEKQDEPKIGYMFEHCNDGFGFFYFENGSSSTTLTANVELLTMEGCELRKFLYKSVNMLTH